MLNPIIIALVSAAVGFYLRGSYEELFGKNSPHNESESRFNSSTVLKPRSLHGRDNGSYTQTRQPEPVSPAAGFSLHAIKDLFAEYNVSLIDDNSFIVLLQAIRNQNYKKMLKEYLDEATSPQKLVDMLDRMRSRKMPQMDISTDISHQPPYISDDRLNKYIIEQNVSPDNLDNLRGSEDKVKLLITLYHALSLKDLENTLGRDMRNILEEYENGNDITASYNKIMKKIKTDFEYLS